MKKLALLLLISACGRGGATGEDDLKAKEGGAPTVAAEGPFELYFSNPLPALIERLRPSKAKTRPTDAVLDEWEQLKDSQVANGGEFAAALVSLMGTANGEGCKVLVADYEFEVKEVAQAMADAKARGCDVRFVTDGTTVAKKDEGDYKEAFDILEAAGIQPHHDGSRGAIMHNKFTIIRGSRGDALWTGSWNYTVEDQTHFWNNGIALHGSKPADIYTEYFEALYARLTPDGTVNKRVKLELPEGRTFKAGGLDFEVYFPSTDKATTRVTELLAGAESSIHILAFSFTSQPMVDAILDRVAQGVTVQGIIENSGACSGAFKALTQTEAQRNQINMLRWVYGPTNFLHHKVFVIDEETVVFGSFNFSQGADDSNDENLLIVKDRDFAKNFVDTFNLIQQVTSGSPQPEACKQ